MPEPRRWQVVSPSGIAWFAKFHHEDAAWSRIIAVTRTRGAVRSVLIHGLKQQGWKVKTNADAKRD